MGQEHPPSIAILRHIFRIDKQKKYHTHEEVRRERIPSYGEILCHRIGLLFSEFVLRQENENATLKYSSELFGGSSKYFGFHKLQCLKQFANSISKWALTRDSDTLSSPPAVPGGPGLQVESTEALPSMTVTASVTFT